MANIALMGAIYPDVPAVLLPNTNGDTTKFVDISDTTAVANDVVSGKYFYLSNGTRVEGNHSEQAPRATGVNF